MPETPATPSAEKTLEEFFAYLRDAEFPCGAGERVRACKIYASIGEQERKKRLKTRLCPIFARSEQDQLRFYDAFDVFFTRAPVLERPIVDRSEKPLPLPARQTQRTVRGFWNRHWKTLILVLAVLVSSGLIYRFKVGTWIWKSWQQTRSDSHTVPSILPAVPSRPPTPSGARVSYYRPCKGLECVEGYRVLFILAPLGICLLIYGFTRTSIWRTYALTLREKRRKPPFVWPLIRFMPSLSTYQGLINRTAEAMRLRIASESTDLDVQRTIHSTIQRAGFPSFHFRLWRKPPEYLFLIERRSPDDHFAAWWVEIAHRLQRLGVAIRIYFYSDDLRRSFSKSPQDSVSTQGLLDIFEQLTAVLFGPGRFLLHPYSGDFYSWVDTSLVKRDRRVLMTPKLSYEWGPPEWRVAASLPTVPARLGNIPAAVWKDSAAVSLNRELHELPSIPPRFFDEWEEDSYGAPPSLAQFLDPDVFQWLCACAVYPRLEWELTMQLGLLVSHCQSGASTGVGPFHEDKLMQLIRLPWFREGRIPGRWRSWLVKHLDPDVAGATHLYLLEALENNRAPKGSFARDQQDLQIAAQRFWLDQDNAKLRAQLEDSMQYMPDIDVAEDFLLDRLRKTWRSPATETSYAPPEKNQLPDITQLDTIAVGEALDQFGAAASSQTLEPSSPISSWRRWFRRLAGTESWNSTASYRMQFYRLLRTGWRFAAAGGIGAFLAGIAVYQIPVQDWREQPASRSQPTDVSPILAPVPSCISPRTSNDTLIQIARLYEQTRQVMQAGDSRTQRMTELIDAANSCARYTSSAESANFLNKFNTESDGYRIVALGLAKAYPSGQIRLAIGGIEDSRSAFEQYHALMLAGSLIGQITASERSQLRKAIRSQIGNNITQADMSRWQPAQDLLRALSGTPISATPLKITASNTTPPRFQASGGTSPYRWSIKGTLPRGYLFDQKLGQITGSCEETLSSTFVVTVIDATGTVADSPGNIHCVLPAQSLPNSNNSIAQIQTSPNNITVLGSEPYGNSLNLRLRYTFTGECRCFLTSTLVSAEGRAPVNDRLILSPGTAEVGLVVTNSSNTNFISEQIQICFVDDKATAPLFCRSFPFAYSWAAATQGGGLLRGSPTQPPSLAAQQVLPVTAKNVCQFYGQADQGASGWNKDESCIIPQAELLDTTYHQNNFICCGGGASSPTTSRDIPPGLEIRVTGNSYWSVANPKLVDGEFFLHTYCGPATFPGPGCNVKVEVFAHYRPVLKK